MESTEIQAILLEAMPDCQFEVSGDGRHVNLVIIGELFVGVRTIKRQQMVYAVLNEHIASGAIHALNMKIFTAEEWASRS